MSSGNKIIAILRAGDIFGEMALFEKASRSATAYVMEDSELLEIDGGGFGEFLNNKPRETFSILMKMISVSSSRLRNMDRYFTTIYEIARSVGNCKNVTALADSVLVELAGSLDISGAVFYLFDIYNEEFSCIGMQGSIDNSGIVDASEKIITDLNNNKDHDQQFEKVIQEGS